jgi:hypothetical protein
MPPLRSPLGCTTAQPDPAAFQAWCQQHAVLWPKCVVGVSPLSGRAVLASADIASGEVVVEVPDGMVLEGETCAIQEQLAGEQACVCCVASLQRSERAQRQRRPLPSGGPSGPPATLVCTCLAHAVRTPHARQPAQRAGC